MKRIKICALAATIVLSLSSFAFAEENIPVPTSEIEKIDEVAATSATAKPKFDLGYIFESEDEPKETIEPKKEDESKNDKADDKEKELEATKSPEAKTTQAPVKTPKPDDANIIKKVCGKDIPAGRYKVTGTGVLKTTYADGRMKSESVVSSDENGVVVLLEDGDILLMEPLEGQEKAKLKFDKASTDASDAVALEKKNDAKVNPKTGDSDAELKAFVGVAACAVAMLAILEVIKKKKSKNN